MTRQELSHHVDLKRQLAADLELLASLEAMAGPGVQHPDGMSRAFGVRDPIGNFASEIADVKAKISQLEAEITRSEAAVVDYITSNKDDRTRMIFRLRFIHCMTWKEVAAAVGWITENGVKLACYRYIARGGPARMGRPPKKVERREPPNVKP